MHLRLNQASLFKTFFFLCALYVFGLLGEQSFCAFYVLGLSNNLHLFIYDIFVGIFLICFNCRHIFFILMGTWRIFVKILFSSLWGLREFLLRYSICPYGDLVEVFSSSLSGRCLSI